MKPGTILGRIFTLAVAGALLTIPASGCGLRASDGIDYYRLRVQLSTSASEVMLSVVDSSRLLSARIIESQGKVEKSGINASDAWMTQARTLPDTAGEISITVDYAVEPIAAIEGFRLRVRAREAAAVSITGARIEGGEEHSKLHYDVGGAGESTDKECDLGHCLAGAEPLRDSAERPLKGMPALAFYYPWYESADCWGSPLLGDRPLRKYSSRDEEAVRGQIREAKGAGIDGFVCSWWGPNTPTDDNFRMLLDLAVAEGFTVCPYFETLTDGAEPGSSVGRNESELHTWLRYLLEEYGDHQAFTRAGRKPLVPVWASDSVPLESWSRVFGWLSEEGLDAAFVANFATAQPRLDALEVFDGLHAYNVLGIVGTEANTERLAQSYEATGRAVRNYHLLGESDPRMWAPAAMPGYDDSRIPERKGQILDRADGAFYRSTLEAAIASDPDALLITSWNEWWEHTYIEPCESYGNRYLEITRDFLCQ